MNFNYSVNQDLAKCFELAGTTGDWKTAEAKFRFNNAGTNFYVTKSSESKKDKIIELMKQKKKPIEIAKILNVNKAYIYAIRKEILKSM